MGAGADIPADAAGGPQRVDSRDSISVPRTAGVGASRPFPWVPANVSSPNPQGPFAAGNGTGNSATAAVGGASCARRQGRQRRSAGLGRGRRRRPLSGRWKRFLAHSLGFHSDRHLYGFVMKPKRTYGRVKKRVTSSSRHHRPDQLPRPEAQRYAKPHSPRPLRRGCRLLD